MIYDAELESPPQAGSGQYQTTTITPYKLLPDYAYGKGYLGESAVQLLLFPTPAKDAKCRPQEIGFLGYSNGYSSGPTGLPTRLSLFHSGWQLGLPRLALNKDMRASPRPSPRNPISSSRRQPPLTC